MVWDGAGEVGRARSCKVLQARLRSFVFTSERFGEPVRIECVRYNQICTLTIAVSVWKTNY